MWKLRLRGTTVGMDLRTGGGYASGKIQVIMGKERGEGISKTQRGEHTKRLPHRKREKIIDSQIHQLKAVGYRD